MRWTHVLLFIAASACTTFVATVPSTAPSAATAARTQTATRSSSLTFSVGPDQARYVATVVAFVDAFNAGDVDHALALLDDDVGGNDCDWGRRVYIAFRGKNEARSWLSGRAADHDRLQIERIANENPDPTTGSRVVAVSWTERRMDNLASPFHPGLSAKVVFNPDGPRITAFPNADVA